MAKPTHSIHEIFQLLHERPETPSPTHFFERQRPSHSISGNSGPFLVGTYDAPETICGTPNGVEDHKSTTHAAGQTHDEATPTREQPSCELTHGPTSRRPCATDRSDPTSPSGGHDHHLFLAGSTHRGRSSASNPGHIHDIRPIIEQATPCLLFPTWQSVSTDQTILPSPSRRFGTGGNNTQMAAHVFDDSFVSRSGSPPSCHSPRVAQCGPTVHSTFTQKRRSTTTFADGDVRCRASNILETQVSGDASSLSRPWEGSLDFDQSSIEAECLSNDCEHLLGDPYHTESLTFQWHMLWDHHPGAQNHASGDDFNLPIHTKPVPHLPFDHWERAVELWSPQRVEGFRSFAASFHPAWIPTSRQPPDSLKMELLKGDIEALLRANLIRPLGKGEHPMNWVSTFTVPEYAKSRRRWIVHTPTLNRKFRRHGLTVSMTTRLFASVKWKCARTADIAAWYHHWALSPTQQTYFCFAFERVTYCVTTIPTGASGCVGLAHTCALAMADFVMRIHPTTFVEVYIDNFRILANADEEANAALQTLQSLDVRWNLPDQHDGRCYDFLGVKYNHWDRTVSLTDKSRDKLKDWQSQMHNFPLASIHTVIRLFGLLNFSTDVLGLYKPSKYYILKFLRRRLGAPLDSAAKPWTIVISLFQSWIVEALQQKPRVIREPQQPQWIVYTDASDYGWGVYAICGETGRVWIHAGSFSTNVRTMHINVKEMFALLFGLKLLDSKMTEHWTCAVYVDNTTVVHTLDKSSSRAFMLNVLVDAIKRNFDDIIVSVAWIPSHLNLADKPSRTGGQSLTEFRQTMDFPIIEQQFHSQLTSWPADSGQREVCEAARR